MGILSLYVATSLDGYIADSEGAVDWLNELSEEGPQKEKSRRKEEGENIREEKDYGYGEYLESVGALVMGRVTYEQVLSFGEWPYKGKKTFVFTRNAKLSSPIKEVKVVNEDPVDFTKRLVESTEKRVWVVGGAQIANLFLNSGQIGEIILTIAPVLLGDGVDLFSTEFPKKSLILKQSTEFDNGMVQLHYRLERTG